MGASRWGALLLLLAAPAAAHNPELSPVDCMDESGIPFLVQGAGTVNCALEAPAEVDPFQFFISQPGTYRFVLRSDSEHLDPRLEIRDPLGELVETQSCSGGDAPAAGIQCVIEVDLQLDPMPQPYDLSVSDDGADEVGPYRVRIERMPPLIPPDAGDFITLEHKSFLTGGVIGVETDIDHVFFEGLSRETIAIEVSSEDHYFDARIEVWTGEGERIAETSCDGGQVPEVGNMCLASLELRLPEDGTYTFSVSDLGHDEAGAPLPAIPRPPGGRFEYLFRRLPEPASALLGAAALLVLGALRRGRSPGSAS